MVIADLQKFLTRGGDGGNRLVGQELSFTLDPKQYKPELKIYTQRDEGLADKGAAGGGDAPKPGRSGARYGSSPSADQKSEARRPQPWSAKTLGAGPVDSAKTAPPA